MKNPHPVAATPLRMPAIGRIGWLRGALGAGLAIVLTGLVSYLALRSDPAMPWLLAPMGAARCLHPPAGGTALITALASPVVLAAGWHFLLVPLALNVVLMLVCGVAWNRLTGHSYRHRAAPAPVIANWVGHIADEDLDAVLEEWDEVLDVSRADLLALVHAIEARVRARLP